MTLRVVLPLRQTLQHLLRFSRSIVKLSKRLRRVRADVGQHVINHRPSRVLHIRHIVLHVANFHPLTLERLRHLRWFHFLRVFLLVVSLFLSLKLSSRGIIFIVTLVKKGRRSPPGCAANEDVGESLPLFALFSSSTESFFLNENFLGDRLDVFFSPSIL